MFAVLYRQPEMNMQVSLHYKQIAELLQQTNNYS